LKNEWEINRLNILSAQFIRSSTENFDRQRRQTNPIEILKGDPLLISVMIEYPPADISKLTNQIAKERKNLQFSIHFTTGQIRNVHLMFSCDQQTAKGRIS